MRLFKRRSNSKSTPRSFLDFLRDNNQLSVVVTEKTALKVPAFFAGVNALAQSISQIPLITYRNLTDNTRERATDIPEYNVLKAHPSRRTTSYEWRFACIVKLLMTGNAFSLIIRNIRGEVQALRFLDHSHFDIKGETITIQLKSGGTKTTYPLDNILHFKYFTQDGISGEGILDYAKEALGFLLAISKYGNEFFLNSAVPQVVLIHPGEISEPAEDNIATRWKNKFMGKRNGVAVLGENIDVKTLTVPNEQAQFNETHQFYISEIARFLRITPHKLQDLSNATFSNVVELNQEFVIDSLMPLTVNMQQAIQRDIFFGRDDLYAEFLFDDLLRGNSKDRYEVYRTAIQNRILTIDEIRRLENRNPLTDAEIERNEIQLKKLNQGGNLNDTNPNTPTGREAANA